jgi:hypothetical protein
MAALGCPLVARGAGLEIPENGALPLARGGTAAAYTGTAYGVEFNAATLADVEGLDLHVDMRLVNNSVTFTRKSISNSEQMINFQPVSNSAGTFGAPGVYAAWHPKNLPLGFGVGVFGPPGDGIYTYADPRQLINNTNLLNADSQSGQRYSLISQNNLILLPTISVGWKIVDWVSLGVSIQAAYSEISISQAVAAGPTGGEEAVNDDAYANLSLKGAAGPIVNPGILFTPVKGFTIGGQFRPGFSLKLPGSISIDQITSNPTTGNPETAPVCLKTSAKASSCAATEPISFSISQPNEARLGAAYEFWRMNVAVEGEYEGWSAFKSIVLDGSNVYATTMASGTQNVGVQTTVKDWKDTWGVRAGASVKLLTGQEAGGFGLTFHFGGLYETNAIPPAYQGVDTVTGNRLGGSLGLTASYRGFGITGAFMGYQTVQFNVNNSVVDRSVSGLNGQPDPSPVIIGNGTYNAGLWVASIGLSYSG